jgi:hypothetical protein
VTSYELDDPVSIPSSARLFFPAQRPDRLWACPGAYPLLTGHSFRGRNVNLTTHLHLVPRSRMVELYLHFPKCFSGIVTTLSRKQHVRVLIEFYCLKQSPLAGFGNAASGCINEGNILTRWTIISFSKTVLTHGISESANGTAPNFQRLCLFKKFLCHVGVETGVVSRAACGPQNTLWHPLFMWSCGMVKDRTWRETQT